MMALETPKGIEINTDEELSLLKLEAKKNKDGEKDGKKSKEKVITSGGNPEAPDKDPKKGAEAEKPVKVTSGYNALETSIDLKGNARIRNYADLGLQFKLGKNALQLGYSGMNQFTQNLQGYFARHVPGRPNLKLIGVVKTTADGVIDDKYGLRYIVSDKLGVDYGRIDVAGNDKGASATFFLGKKIGKKGTVVELLEDVQLDAKNMKVSTYTELRLNQQLSKGFNVFVRGEVPGVKFKDGEYLFGVKKTLGK